MHWLRILTYTSILALNGASAFPQSKKNADPADLDANRAELAGFLLDGKVNSTMTTAFYVTNEYMDHELVRQIVHMQKFAITDEPYSWAPRLVSFFKSNSRDFSFRIFDFIQACNQAVSSPQCPHNSIRPEQD